MNETKKEIDLQRIVLILIIDEVGRQLKGRGYVTADECDFGRSLEFKYYPKGSVSPRVRSICEQWKKIELFGKLQAYEQNSLERVAKEIADSITHGVATIKEDNDAEKESIDMVGLPLPKRPLLGVIYWWQD